MGLSCSVRSKLSATCSFGGWRSLKPSSVSHCTVSNTSAICCCRCAQGARATCVTTVTSSMAFEVGGGARLNRYTDPFHTRCVRRSASGTAPTLPPLGSSLPPGILSAKAAGSRPDDDRGSAYQADCCSITTGDAALASADPQGRKIGGPSWSELCRRHAAFGACHPSISEPNQHFAFRITLKFVLGPKGSPRVAHFSHLTAMYKRA
jgi:hypothetical protein